MTVTFPCAARNPDGGFIEKRMRLKVNGAKSAVARPAARPFLGFRLEEKIEAGTVEIRLSRRSKERLMARIKELTPRDWGKSPEECFERIKGYIIGWSGYFDICTVIETTQLGRFDGHIRGRLRAIILKQWKRKRSMVRKLIRLGASSKAAWRGIYQGNRSIWKLSHIRIVERTLSHYYFEKLGLFTLRNGWQKAQPSTNAHLALEFG